MSSETYCSKSDYEACALYGFWRVSHSPAWCDLTEQEREWYRTQLRRQEARLTAPQLPELQRLRSALEHIASGCCADPRQCADEALHPDPEPLL